MIKVKDILLPEDPFVQKKINEFINQPYSFEDFIDVDILRDEEISLVCYNKTLGDIKRNWVPAYHFSIYLNDLPIGKIDLRIGYNEGLFYGGNIGYSIDEKYRGNGYAPRACKLISSVARAHNMKSINISNEYSNFSSFRVCEKINAKYLLTVKLPKDNDMRLDGNENENIFIWEID